MIHGNVPPLRQLPTFPLIAGLMANGYELPGCLIRICYSSHRVHRVHRDDERARAVLAPVEHVPVDCRIAGKRV